MLSTPFLSGIIFVIIGVVLLTADLTILSNLQLFDSEVKIPERIVFWKKAIGGVLTIIGILALLRDIFL